MKFLDKETGLWTETSQDTPFPVKVENLEVIVSLQDADMEELVAGLADAFKDADAIAIAQAIDTALRATAIKITLDDEAVILGESSEVIGKVGFDKTNGNNIVSNPQIESASSAEAIDISSSDHTCSETTRAIYVGSEGNVVVVMDEVDITFKDVPAGTMLPIQATVVKNTSTADDMVALW